MGADYFIRCLALQPDGKILIGGMFTNFNGVVCRKLARLDTNGTLDYGVRAGARGHMCTPWRSARAEKSSSAAQDCGMADRPGS